MSSVITGLLCVLLVVLVGVCNAQYKQPKLPTFTAIPKAKYCTSPEGPNATFLAIVQGDDTTTIQHEMRGNVVLAKAMLDTPLWVEGNASQVVGAVFGNVEALFAAGAKVAPSLFDNKTIAATGTYAGFGGEPIAKFMFIGNNSLIFAEAYCPSFFFGCGWGSDYNGLSCKPWESCCMISENQGPSTCIPKNTNDYTCCVDDSNGLIEVCTKGESCCPGATLLNGSYVSCCPADRPTCCTSPPDGVSVCCGKDNVCCPTGEGSIICCDSDERCIQDPDARWICKKVL